MEFTNKAGISTRSVNLSELFNIYFLAGNSVKKKKYLNACFVLSKAFELRKVDWSASYVFLVSAIETLIDIEYGNEKPKICETCKMPHHAVRKKYLEFLDRYGYKIDKQTKDLFSKIRNEIVHKGKLLGMSYSHKWVIETQDDLDAQYFSTIDHLNYESFRELVQTCFRTFLLFNFERKSS